MRWVISLARRPSPHFRQRGKSHRVPCRLFYTGVHFLECSALGSQLPLWLRKRPGFIRVGMVLYVWLIALHEWKWGPVCEKRAMPHHSRREVILECSGRRSGLLYKVRRVRGLRDTCTVWGCFKCIEMSHSRLINVRTNFKLGTTDKHKYSSSKK